MRKNEELEEKLLKLLVKCVIRILELEGVDVSQYYEILREIENEEDYKC